MGAIAIESAGMRTTRSSKRDTYLTEIAFGTFLLGLLFAGDIVSTEYILLMGGHELNQYMIPFVSDPVLHVLIKFFVLCFVALAAITCNRIIRRSGSLLIILIITLYSVVVSSNLRMIFQMLFFGSPV